MDTIISLLSWTVQVFFAFLIISFFVSMILSWMPIAPSHPVNRFFGTITRPILEPFDRRIPPVGMFRISFLIAFWALFFVRQMLMYGLTGH